MITSEQHSDPSKGFTFEMLLTVVCEDSTCQKTRAQQRKQTWHIDTSSTWMGGSQCRLCAGKAEVATLNKTRIPILRLISISELIVQSKSTAKYLRLMIDSKMSFLEPANKNATGVSALSQLMANVSAFKSNLDKIVETRSPSHAMVLWATPISFCRIWGEVHQQFFWDTEKFALDNTIKMLLRSADRWSRAGS